MVGYVVMSITGRIKQKSLFKKKMNIEDFIAFLGLAYVVCCLNKDEIGEHTLIYYRLFYDLIKRLCIAFGSKTYFREDEEASLMACKRQLDYRCFELFGYFYRTESFFHEMFIMPHQRFLEKRYW